MSGKIRVGILCGGESAEHEVSLQSAGSILEAIDRDKYDVVLLGIDKAGRWFLGDDARFLLDAHDPKSIRLNETDDRVSLAPGASGREPLVRLSGRRGIGPVDVVFPALHGTYGEDGTVQGLLKLAHVPFVGADVLGSAAAMDKDVMKRLFRDAGLPGPDFLAVRRSAAHRLDFEAVRRRLGLPCFIKPANLGSSVGVHKAKDRASFDAGVQDAFRYDHKILIEEYIEGRELECSVLGNENPAASVPGEVLPRHEFYTYEAKYIDENGAVLEIPAKLPEGVIAEVRRLAVRSFQALECEGMARVDFFLRGDDEVLVNEVNTIPGFTKISMYPKLWEASGVPYPELIDRLIRLALDRFERDQTLAHRRRPDE